MEKTYTEEVFFCHRQTSSELEPSTMQNRKLVENDKRAKLERWERLGVRSRQQLQRLMALLCGSPTLQSGVNRN
jgi:hypothetical protein